MKRTVAIPYHSTPPSEADRATALTVDQEAIGYERTSEVSWEDRRTSEMVFSGFSPSAPWLLVGTFEAE